VEAANTSSPGFCPHCRLLVEPDAGRGWPRSPVRCQHCHLLIGVGRGQPEPSGEPGTKGTAAGVFSRQAKREGGESSSVSPEELLAGIREAAKQLGEPPERLLMVDYQQLAATDPDLPQLSDVFAVFGGWKRARREAAALAPADDG
jgi:hypothetical protein